MLAFELSIYSHFLNIFLELSVIWKYYNCYGLAKLVIMLFIYDCIFNHWRSSIILYKIKQIFLTPRGDHLEAVLAHFGSMLSYVGAKLGHVGV